MLRSHFISFEGGKLSGVSPMAQPNMPVLGSQSAPILRGAHPAWPRAHALLLVGCCIVLLPCLAMFRTGFVLGVPSLGQRLFVASSCLLQACVQQPQRTSEMEAASPGHGCTSSLGFEHVLRFPFWRLSIAIYSCNILYHFPPLIEAKFCFPCKHAGRSHSPGGRPA